jgi:hypothetical protein
VLKVATNPINGATIDFAWRHCFFRIFAATFSNLGAYNTQQQQLTKHHLVSHRTYSHRLQHVTKKNQKWKHRNFCTLQEPRHDPVPSKCSHKVPFSPSVSSTYQTKQKTRRNEHIYQQTGEASEHNHQHKKIYTVDPINVAARAILQCSSALPYATFFNPVLIQKQKNKKKAKRQTKTHE